MTLSKLAKLANVSVSVVSKAFSGRDDVSESMREHVFEIAREHGCFQQFYHVPYDKPVVAVIFPELTSHFYIKYLEILKTQLEENGYTVLLSISNFDVQMEEELVRYYTEHTKIDALISFGNRAKLLKNSETVFISFSATAESQFGCHIARDLRMGIDEALKKLYSLGHRRVAFVGEPFTTSQKVIIKEELEALGFDTSPELIYCSLHRYSKAGNDGARKLWALENKPTAVFGAYGYITQGLIEEFEKMGVKIPEDISVISMDNCPDPLHPTRDVANVPALIEEMCEKAIEHLNERIRALTPNDSIYANLPTVFNIGDTVGKPRK